MVQRMLMVSLFIIGNLLNAWSLPRGEAREPAGIQSIAREAGTTKSFIPVRLNATLTLTDLGYVRDETLQGISATRSYTLNWPDAWKVNPGNSFTVEFSHSPILEEYSSLAVDWNGVRLGSILLTPRTANRGSLTVTIPESEIVPGYNQLRLVLYMGIQDDRCEDPNNPAIWATIHSSSFFELSYEEASPEVDLGRYPAPILDNSNLVQNTLLFVLPDNPTPGEIEAVTRIAAKLGQLAGWRTLELNTAYESAVQGPALPPGDIMYVGEADRLAFLRSNNLPFIQAGGTGLVGSDGGTLPPGAGVVWTQLSSADERSVQMVVTGANEAGLLTAAQGMASEAVYPRLQGQMGVIFSVPELPEPTGAFRQVMTFEELGYQDETASGTRTQTLNFIIPLPTQWQVLTEGTLDLHFAHSRLLHEERSSLTVAVNGSPVGSILLNNENVDDGRATFIVPARLLKIGENKITITTSIELIEGFEDPGQCDEEHIIEAWVVVYSDTTFNLPGGPAALTLNLADYPFAFIGRPDLGDLAFIIPDGPGQEVTNALVGIVSQIGRSAEGETLAPQVISASQAADAGQGLYQILIGQPSQNPVIYTLNDMLPMPFEPGSDTPQVSSQVAQIQSLGGSAGYVQAVIAPDGKPRLVASGSDETGVIRAGLALSRPELIRDLNGDLAILDSNERMVTASINRPMAPAETAPTAESTVPATARWLIWLAGGIFLIAFIALLLVSGSDLVKGRKVRNSDDTTNQ